MCKVLEPTLFLDVVVKDVRPDVKVASSHIKRHQDIDCVVGTICDHNDRRSNGQCPDKEHADPGQPSVPLGESMVSMTCPNEGRDHKDDSVSTEHAVATSVQQESGEKFADRVHAAIAWVREGCDGDGRDAHQIAEGPSQQDFR